jgi:sulfite oxidase
VFKKRLKDVLTSDSFITETDGYDRNHGPIPSVDPDTHVVKINGLVRVPLSLTIHDLRTKFEQVEILCALQCAGNRRHTMRTTIKEVDGIDWFDGAVMNCLWKGPRLRDILREAGLCPELGQEGEWTGHVACICNQVPCKDTECFGASIPLSRAMLEDGDCILALEVC